MNQEEEIRNRLAAMLEGRGAHISFANAVEGFPFDLAGARLDRIPHTAWHLVFHMRIAQSDILEFSRRPDHESPEYPGGYWPEEDGPENTDRWHEEIAAFERDLEDMKQLILDPKSDLFTPFPYGSGQNLFREALITADHNSYHIGQLVDLRMLLDVPIRDW